MTETLQAPLRDQSDIKIFILFLMDSIARPLDFIEINDIVIQNGVVRPFDFCLAFPDLLETGHVMMDDSTGKELYSVTAVGHEAAQSLPGKILTTTKEKALQNAVLLLNLRKSNAGYRYNTEALPNGKYRFTLYYTENKEDVLSVSAVVATPKEAENMEIELEQHPDMFRRALLSLLSNDAGELEQYDPYQLL